MSEVSKSSLRDRKKVLSLALFVVLAISLPVSSYFVVSERSFDDRGMARPSEEKDLLKRRDLPTGRPVDPSYNRPTQRPDLGMPPASCTTNDDCRNEAPYEICSGRGVCLRGDVNNDGVINIADFGEFKEDFISYRESGWDDAFARSDLNMDGRISMADYGILMKSYRIERRLDPGIDDIVPERPGGAPEEEDPEEELDEEPEIPEVVPEVPEVPDEELEDPEIP